MARNVLARLHSNNLCQSIYKHGRWQGEKVHFLREQFQQQKIRPQRDFATAGFSVAGVQNKVTRGTSPEAQVPGNSLPIVIRAILLIRPPRAH